MGKFAAVIAAFALGMVCIDAASIEVENGVYKLEESNFETVLAKNPTLMVEFYAPWCGHCKELTPKYEKAARKLKKAREEKCGADTLPGSCQGPRLGKVDATVEDKLAKKYEVSGYPTLIVFKDGAHWSYEGPREKEEIVQYMQSLSLPFPVGSALRFYFVFEGIYKDLLRMILPGKFRKYLFKWYAFPIILAMPIFFVLCCSFLCGGKKVEPETKAANGDAKASEDSKAPKKKGGRSQSPGAGAKKDKEGEEKKDD